MEFDRDMEDYSILIVDDNPTNLGVIADYLDEFGFDILTARDGEDCLNKANLADPYLILLDVMMPGIDGFETCRRLKANEETKDIPVIFMTALADTDNKVRGFNAGAVDYVTKPIQQAEVLARVNTHLKIRELTENLMEVNTELKGLSEQLQESNQALQKLNADKDKFFSIVAHDLRGPFTPLLGNAELLKEMAEELPRQQIREISESIHRSGNWVLDLLDNLLHWSRLQMGRMEYSPETINLQMIATKTVNLLTENANHKGITLQNSVSPHNTVYADEYMLDTVIRNLTSNALKFTPTNGTITINAQRNADTPPNMLEVSVADTGVGISSDDLDKLFKIDVQHTTSGTAKEQGTGLGLVLCKEMVEMNGGQIWIESILNEGTTVKFTVPASNLNPLLK